MDNTTLFNLVSDKKYECPICKEMVLHELGIHIREKHGEQSFKIAVLTAKAKGIADVEIGNIFGISYRQLEKIITEAYGANISNLGKTKKIKEWVPKKIKEEINTVWSFKQRGNWVTHDGRYRGNWSPYIPRNVILKYSKPGDMILDYFVGGGTTAIEAKLLGRKCLARDINPWAIELTKENLSFDPPRNLFEGNIYEPRVSVGDARELSDIYGNSIDLICAHPPYAGIIDYSFELPGDLSKLTVGDFLNEMGKVAQESFRVLKPGGKCVILIGDSRKHKHIVPIGFQTIRVYLDNGFVLKELVIKRQHNCKTTGFWYTRSIKHNFLLLAHEFLPIFEKPVLSSLHEYEYPYEFPLGLSESLRKVKDIIDNKFETTTVWILPEKKIEKEIRRNLLRRFARPGTKILDVEIDSNEIKKQMKRKEEVSLIYIKQLDNLTDKFRIGNYLSTVKNIIFERIDILSNNDYVVVEAKDLRINSIIQPMGLLLYEKLSSIEKLAIKEIVIVVPDNNEDQSINNNDNIDVSLNIIHKYLLIFSLKEEN